MPHPLTILIPAQFNGPPGSANGGVSAGLAASRIDGPAEVSLRAPPPLDASMDMVEVDDGYEIRHGNQLVMTARPAAPLAPPQQAPTYELARTGPDRFPPAETHAFPHCYVCGPERTEDGLCLFTGQPDGYDGVTDVWTPDESLAGDDGLVRPEILWAALDCPGAFAVGFQDNPMVLARITAQIHERPAPGANLIVAGWSLYDDGRKHGAATALFTRDGQLLAQSEQLWIELKAAAA
tara:strand:+ start:1075 stop:1785 length:711 start_codon:yes stop_codon:yes gene_type:complete